MDSLLSLGILLGACLLGADPPSAGYVEKPAIPAKIQGSAPIILGPLAADWLRHYAGVRAGREIVIPTPFGPPQGKLDPHLRAFLDGDSDFAFLTREIAEADLERFRRSRGVDPVILPIASGSWNSFGYVDPVVIIVHRSNPIRSLDFKQIDAIFSLSRLRGGTHLDDWGSAGVPGWQDKPIRVMGGGAWSGEESARALTIRRHVLSIDKKTGIWRPAPGSGGEADVVTRVANDPLAIGFTGLGHLGPGVRAVALTASPGQTPVEPTRSAITSGRYPLARSVDLLLAPDSSGCLDQALVDFAAFLIGRDGQAIARRHPPFLSLTRNQAEEASRKLAAADCRGGEARN